MKQARTIGTPLRQIRKSLDPKQPTPPKAGKPLRASDIILALTVAMVLFALVARLSAALFGCG
ncbi:hypothetical protein [Martelella endophytica]|uniref:Uncharacterized protein n=1 Tax=Martelella endophytica TaxID=1486262 RepID=A0A0D5LLN4_MAREN|nr:hypothetical protein [Martelella endophytica]AJY45109.1 hypothetical protein TM49_04445 [Martelella endophytica]